MYSESGLGKTTNIGLFARYQFEKTGKRTRLITCDSGFGPCQREVDDEIIIPLCLESAPYPIAVLNKLSRGEWPVKAIDVKAGLWEMGKGAIFEKTYFPFRTDLGGIAVEGLTRICELLRKALTDSQQGTGEPLQGQFEEMGEKFAFQSRGTLFAIQQLINNIVINFRGIPVDRILWTAHESKGKDIMGRSILGPATTGQALTDKVCGWFEIVLHHDSFQYAAPTAANPRRMHTAMRAWFERHPDAEMPKMFWPAKLGLNPKLTGAMYSLFEDGYMPLIMDMKTGEYQQGIHTFLHLIDHDGRLPGEGLVEQPVEMVDGFVEAQDGVVLQTEETGTDATTVERTEATEEPVLVDEVAMPMVESIVASEGKKGRRK